MMKKSFIALLAALMLAPALRADRGMWLPALIGTRIKDMRSKGFRLSAEDIYSVNKASLKDAVVLFNGGCTGELVSGEGLLLTTHHCGYGAIQSHSSVRHDYLTDGFWAMNRSEELPNPGLYVSFLVRMEDVTAQVLDGVRDDLPEARRDSLIRFNAARVADAAVRGTDCRADVEPFFYGNQYFLFVYRNYTDVRLVAAPPSSIGKFGGDIDNWMWPRHTGDFSLFRIYAGPDNAPADYSEDNVPFRPRRSLAISTRGLREGDFTGADPAIRFVRCGRLSAESRQPAQDRAADDASRHHERGASQGCRYAHPLRVEACLGGQRVEKVAGREPGVGTSGHARQEARAGEPLRPMGGLASPVHRSARLDEGPVCRAGTLRLRARLL